MINPTEIKDKAHKSYSSFLVSLVTGENFFPIDFSVGKRPKDFLELRKSVNELIDKSLGYGYTLELETTKLSNMESNHYLNEFLQKQSKTT